jgi:ubiquinone biosynthesis protein UbiJ
MLLSFGQRMLNEQIEASTAARRRLAELDGKRFAVVVKGSDIRIVAEASAGELSLSSSTDAACDVELSAGAFDLLKLARSSGLSDLKNVGASLNGDLNIAESFAELIRLAMPEPEALLADWIGDMPAHAVGQVAREVGGWTARAGKAFEQNLGEYLQEENPLLIPPSLARDFSAGVDRIRDDVDRAERRVALLERRMRGRKA